MYPLKHKPAWYLDQTPVRNMEYSRRSRPYRSKLGSQMEFLSHFLPLYFHIVSFRLPFLQVKSASVLFRLCFLELCL